MENFLKSKIMTGLHLNIKSIHGIDWLTNNCVSGSVPKQIRRTDSGDNFICSHLVPVINKMEVKYGNDLQTRKCLVDQVLQKR